MLRTRIASWAACKVLALAGVAAATCYCHPNVYDKACDGVYVDTARVCGGSSPCPDVVENNPSARSVRENLGHGSEDLGPGTPVVCQIRRKKCGGLTGSECVDANTLKPLDEYATVDNNITGLQCGTGPCLPQAPGGNG